MFPEVLNFIYEGRITITDDTVIAIASLADQMMMDELKKFSKMHLEGALGPATAIKFLLDAVEVQDEALIKKCIDVIVPNFQMLHTNDEMKRLPFPVVYQILKRDDLQVWDECDFYLFIDNYHKQHSLTKEQLVSLYELGRCCLQPA